MERAKGIFGHSVDSGRIVPHWRMNAYRLRLDDEKRNLQPWADVINTFNNLAKDDQEEWTKIAHAEGVEIAYRKFHEKIGFSEPPTEFTHTPVDPRVQAKLEKVEGALSPEASESWQVLESSTSSK